MGTKYSHLSLDERHAIARLRAAGQSYQKIAASLGRPASTITREVGRNIGSKVGYQPRYADEMAWGRRWRGSKLSRHPPLQELVLGRLAQGWSPEQIAGRLKQEKAKLRISHETIYRFVYAQIRRTNDYSWRHYLPKAKCKRGRSRRSHRPIEHIKDRVCIGLRPKSVHNRRQPGHWETDLLHPRKSGAAVLVAHERTSRYTLLAKQPSKHAHLVSSQLQHWFTPLPTELRRSLTQDNGPEFFLHHQLNPIGIKTYFCNPYSPWQKGGVENINGRIRRYIPLGTDPQSFTHDDLQHLAARLNTTPRKCLRFKTPAEVFLKLLLHFKCESTSRPSPE
jgi:IS30 family transposase